MNRLGPSVSGCLLGRRSWKEAEEILGGNPIILIPLGAGLKEHGLHLPLDTDQVLAEHLTRRIAERLEVVVLPTVTYGYYPAFTEYPGSVSVRAEVLTETIFDIVTSISAHGPRRFYCLNTGISTIRALEPARLKLAAEGIDFRFTDISEALAPIEHEICAQQRGTHADESETSMMLAIDSSRVRIELASRDDGEPRGSSRRLTRDKNTSEGIYSLTGAWGDPTLASKEKGWLLLERLVDAIERDIGAFEQHL